MSKKIDELQKVLIPMIRKITPGLIAASVVGVQPMSGPVGTIFTMSMFDSKRRFRETMVMSNMEVLHTAFRPFMRKGDSEPNEHYRPWLEENVGEQGVDWNWEIDPIIDNGLLIEFATLEHGTLFELKWP